MITRDTFDDTFQPLDAPSGEPLWSWAEVQDQELAHVWTIVTGDDNESAYAMPGFHIVNREGYVVTARPWTDETLDAVWWERD